MPARTLTRTLEHFADPRMQDSRSDDCNRARALQGTADLTHVLEFLAEQQVNGPKHPGAVGAPPAKAAPPPPPLPRAADPHIPPSGWRAVIEKEGPEGWAKAVREHRKTRGAWGAWGCRVRDEAARAGDGRL